MFSRFRSKIRVRGNRGHEHSFKDRSDWLKKIMKNEDSSEITMSDMDISENLGK